MRGMSETHSSEIRDDRDNYVRVCIKPAFGPGKDVSVPIPRLFTCPPTSQFNDAWVAINGRDVNVTMTVSHRLCYYSKSAGLHAHTSVTDAWNALRGAFSRLVAP